MTNQELDALDVLVARHVMGWPEEQWNGPSGALLVEGEGRTRTVSFFIPSRHMEYAWLVVERLHELGWAVELRLDPTLTVEPNTVFFYNGGGLGFRPQPIVESDDSMALAIVRGALKALRVEVEE